MALMVCFFPMPHFSIAMLACGTIIPGAWLWMQASQHLEKLRADKQSDDRLVTLWAYWISAVIALFAILCSLFVFVWQGLQ